MRWSTAIPTLLLSDLSVHISTGEREGEREREREREQGTASLLGFLFGVVFGATSLLFGGGQFGGDFSFARCCLRLLSVLCYDMEREREKEGEIDDY
jgi:hypothetical protein